jgi:hypothetical protein
MKYETNPNKNDKNSKCVLCFDHLNLEFRICFEFRYSNFDI